MCMRGKAEHNLLKERRAKKQSSNELYQRICFPQETEERIFQPDKQTGGLERDRISDTGTLP